MKGNPQEARLGDLVRAMRRRRLDAVVLFGEKNVFSLTGANTDNGCLVVAPDGSLRYATDFRYMPAVRRTAPHLRAVDCKRDLEGAAVRFLASVPRRYGRIGFEGSIPASRYRALTKRFRKATFVDVEDEVLLLRAVKTPAEIAQLAAAEHLNDEIWAAVRKDIRPGMTEKDIQRTIRAYMNALGDGEAFETIVCAGANAAECHHVPDDTVWRRGEALLVDMGVCLNGVMSDMTRCIKAADRRYREIYGLVLSANAAAIAAARPGMTGRELDAVARRIIRKAGYGKAFGHALGHGVGYDIHEYPVASARSDTVLKPGMAVTIEPGVYLPGELGVRIEDLVLITDTGCEVLSGSGK